MIDAFIGYPAVCNQGIHDYAGEHWMVAPVEGLSGDPLYHPDWGQHPNFVGARFWDGLLHRHKRIRGRGGCYPLSDTRVLTVPFTG